MVPAITPITAPCHGSTKPDAGVMVPSPATAPEIMPSTEGLPRVHHSSAIQANTPAQAARCVETMAKAARRCAQSRATVETEPADPQQPGADHREREIERREIF